MERAKINVAGVDLNNEQAKQQLKTDIQTAIANSRAARRSYIAAQAAEEASRLAFESAQQRFDIGAANQTGCQHRTQQLFPGSNGFDPRQVPIHLQPQAG